MFRREQCQPLFDGTDLSTGKTFLEFHKSKSVPVYFSVGSNFKSDWWLKMLESNRPTYNFMGFVTNFNINTQIHEPDTSFKKDEIRIGIKK